jgi:hypothetical protein
MIEDKVHIQHMPRQEMVETLVHRLHLAELMSLLQKLPVEEFAVTLEALYKDSRYLFGHKFRKIRPITPYRKFRIPAMNNWFATEGRVSM